MKYDFLKQIGKLTAEEADFIESWRNLTDEQKDKVLNQLQLKTDQFANDD